VAVAVVRHRPASQHVHPAFAADVAAALAWLLGRAESLGFDPDRVFLTGHASGAQLAALVALDESYLARHGLSSALLAGVVPISGVYDLESEVDAPPELLALYRQAHPTPDARRSASPLRQVRSDAPDFLVLAAGDDMPGYRAASLTLSEALRAAGHPNAETFIAADRNHRSVLDLSDGRNSARHHLLALVGVGPRVAEMQELLAARRHWRAPKFSTEPFWDAGELVESHAADAAFRAWLRRLFASGRARVGRVSAQRFDAIDLYAWLAHLGPERAGSGRWLVLTNARRERAVLDLDALRPYRPVVVVGIDGERNLFEVVDLYHTLRRYTWKDHEPERWLLARTLGAFIHFLEAPPPELLGSPFGRFALTVESFRRSAEDPLAPLRRDLSSEMQEFLIRGKACVSCHGFRGVGARAGHLRARDGDLVGGFALALEEYPPEVWRRYVFEQLDVAAEIGATAVVLDPAMQKRLYETVVRERDSASSR
jgi:acetyl esterase/lipase